MSNKTRIAYWDNLKFILIYLVVVGHFLIPITHKSVLVNTTYQWIYFFHMPAFVFISGFFSKNYVHKEPYKINRITSYFILYFIFNISLYIVEHFILGFNPGLGLFSTKSAPWYIMAMGVWLIIIPYFKDLNPYKATSLMILFGVLIGVDKSIGSVYTISRIIILLPFFIAGYYFNGKFFTNIKPWMRILAAIALIVIFILIYNNTKSINKYMGIVYCNRGYHALKLSKAKGMILRLIFYAISAFMTICFMCLIPNSKNIFTTLGERSLGIFIIHRLSKGFFIKYGFYKSIGHGAKALICVLVLSMILTLLSSLKIFDNLFRKILSFKIYKKDTP